MVIFNTNEFLRKTFSKTIFGTAALRPEAVCADGFTLSITANTPPLQGGDAGSTPATCSTRRSHRTPRR